MRSHTLLALALAATAVGCAPPLRGITHLAWRGGDHFYVAYVEDISGSKLPYATRLQRCVVNPDNTAVCVPEAQANAVLTPDAPPATTAATGRAPAPTATGTGPAPIVAAPGSAPPPPLPGAAGPQPQPGYPPAPTPVQPATTAPPAPPATTAPPPTPAPPPQPPRAPAPPPAGTR